MQSDVYEELHGERQQGLTRTQRGLVIAIFAAIVITILDTEPELPPSLHDILRWSEATLAAVFSIEFVLRLWSAGSQAQFQGLRGRLRYLRQPLLVIDMLALLPFLVGAVGAETMVLRALRALRLLALSKLLRYSQAARVVIASIVERRYELVFALMIAALMILVSSTALYLIEGVSQPKAFGSILRAMWWSVVTLTTVGYGDVFPLTPLGKVCAAVTALAGIGMIAMPTGILAAAFSDGFARARHEVGDVDTNEARRSQSE